MSAAAMGSSCYCRRVIRAIDGVHIGSIGARLPGNICRRSIARAFKLGSEHKTPGLQARPQTAGGAGSGRWRLSERIETLLGSTIMREPPAPATQGPW